PATAQRASEAGVQVIGTLSDPALAAVGGYGGFRLSRRARVAGYLGAGISDEQLAWRGELLGHFLFSPDEAGKPGFYFGAGIAGVEGAVGRGYLVVTAGVEGRPGAASGWVLEAGVGGGFRVGLGYRWRWFAGP
ncbi:MAG TPA: hypothetical protein VHH32_01685, partial [Gemmatimonadales bacterium]|nr:hypothetical protein [Gemmatimonadales bacterium]